MNCYQYNHKLALACGLVSIPSSSRRTFDRRLLKMISTDIKQRITAMGYLFVTDDLADPSITATEIVVHSDKSKG